MSGERQTCTYCVMDTSDADITFDASGRCHYCTEMAAQRGVTWFDDDAGLPLLNAQLEAIKKEGKGKDFDCILGLSGGADSSYLALKAHDWGLRPLVVHVDAGWNSELAVANIQRILEYTGWDLHTHVINWEDMRELQIAYLRSGVANQDVPQDHAFFAALYKFASDNGVRTVLSGGNNATEGIFPTSWHGAAMDAINLKAIHERFGTQPLQDYPVVDFGKYYVWYPFIKRMSPVRLLNFIEYDKAKAMVELQERVGWRTYERKHGESLFTRFFQNYYLPTRFGYDKRRPHLSSMIVSGQITREDALSELDKPLYEESELKRDQDYVVRKLRLTDDEWQELMHVPLHEASDFPNWNARRDRLKRVQQPVLRITGRNVSYS